MSENTLVTRNQILSELQKSVHGELTSYRHIIEKSAKEDPEFLAHLMAWDSTHGQIKDAKIALPIISLKVTDYPTELLENSLACLALQDPRQLLRAYQFGFKLPLGGARQKRLDKVVKRYIRLRESDVGKWHAVVSRQRRAMKELYVLSRCPIPAWAKLPLFKSVYVKGSVFEDIRNLRNLTPEQQAAVIQKRKLSPLIVSGALAGSKASHDSSAVTSAVVDNMTGDQFLRSAKKLEKKGAGKNEGLKNQFRKKAAEAVKGGKTTLKAGKAAEVIEDEGLRTTLLEVQERQIAEQKGAGKGIDGNWLVIVDCSNSQESALELGKEVGAALAKFVTGKVWMVFCNDRVMKSLDVSGWQLERIKQESRLIIATGNTSYGVGLDWALQYKHELDGIVIVGDGGENSAPLFAPTYHTYVNRMKRNPIVYLYQTHVDPKFTAGHGGQPDQFKKLMAGMTSAQIWGFQYSALHFGSAPIGFETFDLTHGKVDYYSIPNMVQQMKVNKWSVLDQIMACPLFTLDQVMPEVSKVGA